MARTAAVLTVAEARRAIGEAVSARMWRGSTLPGHNPRAAPPVPLTVVATGPAWTAPGVIFTWKSEHQDAPYFRINAPPAWNSQVAHRAFAVIIGLPVAAVLEWGTDQQRPTLVQTVDLAGHFGTGVHGWRA